MGVMALKHPERVPDLAAYMGQIIQASRQFKGTPWQDYNTRFQMQVAAAKRPQLAVVDTSLWAIVFSKAEPREDCNVMSQECTHRIHQLEQKGRSRQASDAGSVKSQS